MKRHVIKDIDFTGKLGDIVLFVDFSVNAYQTSSIKEKELKKWLAGVPEMVRDRNIFKSGLTDAQMEEASHRWERGIESSYRAKFDSFPNIALNLGLVMMCSILEQFFEHVLNVIFTSNIKTLLTLSKEKNVTLERFLAYNSYEEVLNSFKNKYLDHFSRLGMEDMLKEFDKIGIKKESVFSWALFTKEVQRRFAGVKSNTLVEIYKKRHSIVHEGLYPIETVEEFLTIKDIFTKVLLNLAYQTMKVYHKYGVILEAHEQIRNSIEAEGGDPDSYPPKDWTPK